MKIKATQASGNDVPCAITPGRPHNPVEDDSNEDESNVVYFDYRFFSRNSFSFLWIYILEIATTITISITLHGKEISNAPFKVKVSDESEGFKKTRRLDSVVGQRMKMNEHNGVCFNKLISKHSLIYLD